jgi:hypothetical protein
MERTHRYFDRKCKMQSLNAALTVPVIWSSYFSLGIVMMVKYAGNGDDFGLYLGAANTAVGIFGIFVGTPMVHAVVLRLIAESRTTS